MTNNSSTSISIIVGFIILGLFYFGTQFYFQRSDCLCNLEKAKALAEINAKAQIQAENEQQKTELDSIMKSLEPQKEPSFMDDLENMMKSINP